MAEFAETAVLIAVLDSKSDDLVSHCAWCGKQIPWGSQTCGKCP